jgi:hypothetical protein
MPAHAWSSLPIEQLPFSQLNTEPIGSGPFTVINTERDTSGLINHYSLTAFRDNNVDPKINRVELFFYQNEELALALIDILEHKYNKPVSGLFDIPNKIPDLHLWIDASDLSSIVKDNQNKISTITDKSISARVFSQSNTLNKPTLINVTPTGSIGINKNNTILFNQNEFLYSSQEVSVINDFTYISLIKTKAANAKAMLLSSANERIIQHNGSAIELQSPNLNISSEKDSLDFTYSLCIINASDSNIKQSWIATDLNNAASVKMGITSIVKTSSINLKLNTLGDNLNTPNHSFEKAEELLYKRQLSTIEIKSLVQYLSRKWSGQYLFNVDTSFVQSII